MKLLRSKSTVQLTLKVKKSEEEEDFNLKIFVVAYSPIITSDSTQRENKEYLVYVDLKDTRA